MPTFNFVTFAERPGLVEQTYDIIQSAWQQLAINDSVSGKYWDDLERDFPEFQFLLLDEQDAIMAVGHSIPVVWDGDDATLSDDGWDWVLPLGVDGRARSSMPNTLSALGVTIAPHNQGKGISREAVNAMRGLAAQHGFDHLIAPVRPTWKARYPLTPMERYIRWTTDDGAPFDPWMRVHWRLGARIAKACPRSMVVENTIAKWQDWTGMTFPESGRYIVPSALVPVDIDREADKGVYVEPNVWMVHDVPMVER